MCNLQKQPPEVFCKKKVFLEILQNSQENACARVSFLIKFTEHFWATPYFGYNLRIVLYLLK